MSHKTLCLTDTLYQYLLNVSLRENPIQKELRDATRNLSSFDMQISPEQGQFMALLVKLMGAKKTLEIGVFTGYSSLAVALALPQDGQMVVCDVNEEWTSLAQEFWTKASVRHKINLVLRPALETLETLIATKSEANSFDFIFIDADKANYSAYYECALKLCRPGGLILIDNTLWDGAVADPTIEDASTKAIRFLNDKIHHDNRVDMCLLPVSDGLTLAMKK